MFLVASFVLLERFKILITALRMKISKQSLFEMIPVSFVSISCNMASGKSLD